MSKKSPEDILKTILAVAEEKPQKEITLKRFGVPFTLQAIDNKTLTKMREQATFKTKGGADQVDNELLNLLIIQKGCLVPDWSAKEFTEKYGDPTAAINSVLLSGECARLSSEILDLSGFTEGIDDLKN